MKKPLLIQILIYSFKFNLLTHPVGRSYQNFHIKIDRLVRPHQLGKWDFFQIYCRCGGSVDLNLVKIREGIGNVNQS
jgi:hypothetical protein